MAKGLSDAVLEKGRSSVPENRRAWVLAKVGVQVSPRGAHEQQVDFKLLSRRSFRAWLSTYAPGDEVGLSGEYGHCPLARFLQQQLGEPDIVVSSIHYARIVYTFYDLPRWAAEFVLGVDRRGTGRRITAKGALRVFDHG